MEGSSTTLTSIHFNSLNARWERQVRCTISRPGGLTSSVRSEAQLMPVLRSKDYEAFSLGRALEIIGEIRALPRG